MINQVFTSLVRWIYLGIFNLFTAIIPKHDASKSPVRPTEERGLPNDPFFIHLADAARNGNKVIIRDPRQNLHVDHVRFLRDIVQFRLVTSSVLPVDILDENGIIKDDDVYILVYGPSSYQYLVALFGILAVGGAAVLLPPDLSAEEITAYAHRSNAQAVAFTPEHGKLMEASNCIAKQRHNMTIHPIPIILQKPNSTMDIPLVDENISIPPSRPGLVQFSSGTTGTPKGVVHPRKYFNHQVQVYFDCQMSKANGLSHILGPEALYLSYRSFHWGGGIRNATAAILAGVCTEIYHGDISAGGMWERLKRGDVRFFICWSTMWTDMKRYYEEHLAGLPAAELKEYTDGIGALRLAKSDSWSLTPSVKHFWRDVFGLSIGVNYAGAEMCIAIGKSSLDREEIDERSIGLPMPGVDVKLSEGNSGEICIKSPLLFSCYLGDPAATQAAFDDEGYYKTGDVAHLDGDQYIIDGRISQNTIRFLQHRVPILEVEEGLMNLPYITEAYVVSVPDAQILNRTAVLIRVKEGRHVNLEILRKDMAATLAEYKLPNLLRILKDGDSMPKTHSGKIDLRKAGTVFFPQSVEGDIKDLPQEVEVWGFA